MKVAFQSVLISADDDRARVCIKAAAKEESSPWLRSIPVSSLGPCLEDEVVCVATGLHLELYLCTSHVCQHCGAQMEQLGLHGLSCKKSQGRHFRHAAVRKRSLDAAKIPAQLDPSTLSRSDEKRFRWSHPHSLEKWANINLGVNVSTPLVPPLPHF